MSAGAGILLTFGLALQCIYPLAAQDSVHQKRTLRPFAVPQVQSPEPSPPRPRPPPIDQAALVSSTTAALRELRHGIGPENWKRSHPAEAAQLYQPELPLIGGAPWCIRFSLRWAIPQGRFITRQAFFFPPTPAGMAHPGSKAPTVNQCRLAAVLVTLEEPDTLVGDSLGTRLRASLANEFPIVSETLPALTRWPARRIGSAWRSGGVLIETAFRLPFDGKKSEGEIVAVASLPLALEEEVLTCLPQCLVEESAPTEALDSGISIIRRATAIAGLPPGRLAPVLGLLAEIRPPVSSDTVFRIPGQRLVRVLRRWLADSGRTARQRAATLLVADRVLALTWSSVDRAARNQLVALGAEMADLPSDVVGYGYDSNWLREAHQLDSQGPIGAAAMAVMIRDNFLSLSDCRPDGYTEVIRLVKPFLTTAAGARSGPAHLALADAYRDMLTLASGGGSESLHPVERLLKATPEELLRIRRLAISHYRSAFKLDSTSAQSRVSQPDAWRLQAGLLPTQTRYACTDD